MRTAIRDVVRRTLWSAQLHGALTKAGPANSSNNWELRSCFIVAEPTGLTVGSGGAWMSILDSHFAVTLEVVEEALHSGAASAVARLGGGARVLAEFRGAR